MNEFRGRHDFAVRPDRPIPVVQIERGDEIREVDIGLPIRVDRPGIAPIGFARRVRTHARIFEAVRDGLAVAHDVRDDFLTEIVLRACIRGVTAQLLE